MTRFDVISTAHRDAWNRCLDESCGHDFYHLASYHDLARQQGEGNPLLFAFEHDEYKIALPILVRGINTARFVSVHMPGARYRDATSVYGYAGPVVNQHPIPVEVKNLFWKHVSSTLKEMDVVSVFSRLHPLLAQKELLNGYGETVPRGTTVSIDLAKPLDQQWGEFREGHKYDIRKLRQHGLLVIEDKTGQYLDDFVEMYNDTMDRVNAKPEYRYQKDYFSALLGAPEKFAHLFICLQGSTPLCGGIFTERSGIVQYHLSGTTPHARKLAPVKLVIDEVRMWATDRKCRAFHLGGGVGGSTDSLFTFKTGFSRSRHTFSVWRWVLDPAVYSLLCADAETLGRQRGESLSKVFFPFYRQVSLGTAGK